MLGAILFLIACQCSQVFPACQSGFEESCDGKGQCKCLGLEGSKCVEISDCKDNCSSSCGINCFGFGELNRKCRCDCPRTPMGEECSSVDECMDCPVNCFKHCKASGSDTKKTCQCYQGRSGEDRCIGSQCYLGPTTYCPSCNCLGYCKPGTPFQRKEKDEGVCFCTCLPVEIGGGCKSLAECAGCPKGLTRICERGNASIAYSSCNCITPAPEGGSCNSVEGCMECSNNCQRNCTQGICKCVCPPLPLGFTCTETKFCAPCQSSNCTAVCVKGADEKKTCGCHCLRIPGPCNDTSTCPDCAFDSEQLCEKLPNGSKNCTCKKTPYTCGNGRRCPRCPNDANDVCLPSPYVKVGNGCFCEARNKPRAVGYGTCHPSSLDECEECPGNDLYTKACIGNPKSYRFCSCLVKSPGTIQLGGLCNNAPDCSCTGGCEPQCLPSGPDARNPKFCSCQCFKLLGAACNESAQCQPCPSPCNATCDVDPKDTTKTTCQCKCPIKIGQPCTTASDCEVCPHSQCIRVCLPDPDLIKTESVCRCLNCLEVGAFCANASECLPCPDKCVKTPICSPEYEDERATCQCNCTSARTPNVMNLPYALLMSVHLSIKVKESRKNKKLTQRQPLFDFGYRARGCRVNQVLGSSNTDCEKCGDTQCSCEQEALSAYKYRYWCYLDEKRCVYNKHKSMEECSKKCLCDGGQCESDRQDPKVFLCNNQCKYRSYSESDECAEHCRCKFGKCVEEEVENGKGVSYRCKALPYDCDLTSSFAGKLECLENCPCATGTCYEKIINADIYGCSNSSSCDHTAVMRSYICETACNCPEGECKEARNSSLYQTSYKVHTCYKKQCIFDTSLNNISECQDKCGCFDGACVLNKNDNGKYKCVQKTSTGNCGNIGYKTKEECDKNCECFEIFTPALVQNKTECKQRETLKDWFCFTNMSCTNGVKYKANIECMKHCRCPEGECIDLGSKNPGFLCRQRNCRLGLESVGADYCNLNCDCSNFESVKACIPYTPKTYNTDNPPRYRCQEHPNCPDKGISPGEPQYCAPDVECLQPITKGYYECVNKCVKDVSYKTIAECQPYCKCTRMPHVQFACMTQTNGTFACKNFCNHSLTFPNGNDCNALCDCEGYSCLDLGKNTPIFQCLKADAKERTINCDTKTTYVTKERCDLNCRCKTGSSCHLNTYRNKYYCQKNTCRDGTFAGKDETACNAVCKCADKNVKCIKNKNQFECLQTCSQHDVGFPDQSQCTLQCNCPNSKNSGKCELRKNNYYCEGPCATPGTIFQNEEDCRYQCGNCKDEQGFERSCVSKLTNATTYECKYKCPFLTKYGPYGKLKCGDLCGPPSCPEGKCAKDAHTPLCQKMSKKKTFKECQLTCACGTGYGCTNLNITYPGLRNKAVSCRKVCKFNHYFNTAGECKERCGCNESAGCAYSATNQAWVCRVKGLAIYDNAFFNESDCTPACQVKALYVSGNQGSCKPNGNKYQCYDDQCTYAYQSSFPPLASSEPKCDMGCRCQRGGRCYYDYRRNTYECGPPGAGDHQYSRNILDKCTPAVLQGKGTYSKSYCQKCCSKYRPTTHRCAFDGSLYHCVPITTNATDGCDYWSTFQNKETCVREACYCIYSTCFKHNVKGLDYYKCAEDFDKIPKTCTYSYISASKYTCLANCFCPGTDTTCTYELRQLSYKCKSCATVIGIYYTEQDTCIHQCTSRCGNCLEVQVDLGASKLSTRYLCKPFQK